MPPMTCLPDNVILTINGGSSSVKFAVFSLDRSHEPSLIRRFSGQVERIGTPRVRMTATLEDSTERNAMPIAARSFGDCVQSIVTLLRERLGAATLAAIAHRLVRGGPKLIDHQLITPDLLAELHRNAPLDLDHLPNEIKLIETIGAAFPSVRQVACFDTAFHRDLPRVAQLFPIPRHYLESGVRRFGFHGLSYTYLMTKLAEVAGADAARGRVVLAHLGSGASMAAVRYGKPIDTTMAFTPTAGLMMATRPGDLDPGLLVYLMRQQHLTPDAMDRFISHECGLLGVSETSGDIRDLLAAASTDARAADAVDLFCYQAKKQLWAMVGALGGVDTIVFAGGIGEHSPDVRGRICDGLGVLGFNLDDTLNESGGSVISSGNSRVQVRVISTDEEQVLADVAYAFVPRSGASVEES